MSSKKGLGPASPILAAMQAGKTAAAQQQGKGKRTTLAVSVDVAERVRDCAAAENVPVAALVETSLLAFVADLETQHGPGYVYPRRQGSRGERLSAAMTSGRRVRVVDPGAS